MDNTKKSRNSALDLIRIFALFCVVSLHFFLYSGYYVLPLADGNLFFATLARSFFMVCVPLFLLLSGYLMCNKKPTKEYYTKIARILGEYLLASLFCMACLAFHQGNGLIDIIQLFCLQSFGIFSYEAAEYGWYVEMYIGLFLLIPYLNILYNGLQGKQAKQRLIFTMLLLSGIPEVLNSISFTLPWTVPYNDPSDGLMLFPTWWSTIYPVTYYFIGAYLNEYPLQLSKARCVVLLILSNLLSGTVNYLNSRGGILVWGSWQSHQSLLVASQAVFVFVCFLQLDVSRIGTRTKKLLSLLSDLTFTAYLVSSVFDKLFYKLAGMRSGAPAYRPEFYFLLVPLVLLCSFIAAFILVSIYKLLCHILSRIRIHMKGKKVAT